MAQPIIRSIILEPDLAEASRARRFLERIAAEAGFLPDRIFDLTVATSEAIANAVEHSEAKDLVEVKSLLYPDRLEVLVEGPGEFRPPLKPMERSHRGLGLPLMASLSDHLTMYSGPRGGTHVVLTFFRSGVQEAREDGSLPPALRELLEDNELVSGIVNNASMGIYVLDSDLRYRWANPSCKALLDEPYRSADLPGLYIGEVVPGAHASGLIDDLRQVSRTGRPLTHEGQLLAGYERGPTWWRRKVFPLRGYITEPPYDLLVVAIEETERRRAEMSLRESEERVRRKLECILSPEECPREVELGDLIDTSAVQSFLDDFHRLSGIPMSIIDKKGMPLVGAGWSNICRKSQPVPPATCARCLESDLQLSAAVPEDGFNLYRCKNNVWNMATPIVVNGSRVGSILSGQFFFDDEEVDVELVRAQARNRGLQEECLGALDAVPRLPRQSIQTAMSFCTKLACMLSQLNYNTIKLARAVTERDNKLAESLSVADQEPCCGTEGLLATRKEIA